MSREAYQRQLQSLQEGLLTMGSLVERNIRGAVDSLRTQDLEKASEVVDQDDVVDQMQTSMEEECMRLIALQQPVAGDLRTIGAVLMITDDLERIADQATNIAEVTLRIGDQSLIKPLVDIPRMGDLAMAMLRDALNAFVRRDIALAKEVQETDDSVDEIYGDLMDELRGFVLDGGDRVRSEQALHLLFVARYLERIADHATNIAERVAYMITGQRYDHGRPGRDLDEAKTR